MPEEMWQLENFPVVGSRASYKEQLEKSVSHVSGHDDVLAVYTMGGTTCPGISDLDLKVVTRDVVRDARALSVQHGRFDRNLLIHDVLVLRDKDFCRLQSIVYASNVTSLWKRESYVGGQVDPVPGREQALALLLDFIESRLYEYHELQVTDRVDVRQWSTWISSFLHSARLVSLVLGQESVGKYQGVLDAVAGMRESWLAGSARWIPEHSAPGAFCQVLESTRDAFGLLLSECLAAPELQIDLPCSDAKIRAGRRTVRFFDGPLPEVSLRRNRRPFSRFGLTSTVRLPGAYRIHLAGYWSDGAIGKYFRSLSNAHAQLPVDTYRHFQIGRIRAIDDHSSFLHRNGLHFSLRGYVCLGPLAKRAFGVVLVIVSCDACRMRRFQRDRNL